MGRHVGRKIRRTFNKIGRKVVRKSAKIGRKLSKAGNFVGRIAPLLAAVPGVGPELAVGATAASTAARGVGELLQRKNVKSNAKSLAETYHAAKRSRQ